MPASGEGDFFKNIGDTFTEGFSSLLGSLPGLLYVIAQIVLIIVIARILIGISKKVTKKMIKRKQAKELEETAVRKYETGLITIRTVVKYLIYFFAAVSILSVLNLTATVTSVITAAGVGGIIIGFGAQSLVKDFFAGISMLFENQFAIGEYIEIANVKGIVENITIRTTILKAFTGEVITIPNGIIDRVTNYTRGNVTFYLDTHIAHGEDIEKSLDIIAKALSEYKGAHEGSVVDAVAMGVNEISETGLELRSMVVTAPMAQWEAERDLKRLTYERLSENGVRVTHVKNVLIEEKSAS